MAATVWVSVVHGSPPNFLYRQEELVTRLHTQVQDLERYITFLQANRSQLQSPSCHTPSGLTPSSSSGHTPSPTPTPTPSPPSTRRRVRFAEPLQSGDPDCTLTPNRCVSMHLEKCEPPWYWKVHVWYGDRLCREFHFIGSVVLSLIWLSEALQLIELTCTLVYPLSWRLPLIVAPK